MTFMLILGGLVIAALVLTGRVKYMKANDWLAVAVALLGVNLCRGGNWIAGSGLIAIATLWSRSVIFGNAGKKTKPKARSFEVEHARSLLGLPEGADKAAINAAWRSRLSTHHPDRGGDGELARQLNHAREILLKETGPARD
ncbi:J domain-containing protein [Parasphingorhabdus sp. JC815]|uniref:J domain-containing protein n=1 Tax=Parasphingorhabdus sp. JC815 TaxID=3232140 RepID=UPI0034591C4E